MRNTNLIDGTIRVRTAETFLERSPLAVSVNQLVKGLNYEERSLLRKMQRVRSSRGVRTCFLDAGVPQPGCKAKEACLCGLSLFFSTLLYRMYISLQFAENKVEGTMLSMIFIIRASIKGKPKIFQTLCLGSKDSTQGLWQSPHVSKATPIHSVSCLVVSPEIVK